MKSDKLLSISNLYAATQDHEIIKGLSLEIGFGEVHAIMGPNGSGKSTLAKVLSGHPSYSVTQGSISFCGEDILALEPDERARKGLFLAFQYPQEIPGVSILNFLRTALNALREKDISVADFRKLLSANMAKLGIDQSFATRHVNDGFSGGEKKRNEILQLLLLNPLLAVLDETDSGLDIDALKVVAGGVNQYIREPREASFEDSTGDKKPSALVITHYNRILDYLKPDFVHVLHNGRIVRSGKGDLALQLEEKGYDWIIDQAGRQVAA